MTRGGETDFAFYLYTGEDKVSITASPSNLPSYSYAPSEVISYNPTPVIRWTLLYARGSIESADAHPELWEHIYEGMFIK